MHLTEWNEAPSRTSQTFWLILNGVHLPISSSGSSLRLSKLTERWDARLLLQFFLRQVVADLDQVDRVKSYAQLRKTRPDASFCRKMLHSKGFPLLNCYKVSRGLNFTGTATMNTESGE